VFFYEVGRLVEIEKLSAYAKAFGLGEYTGIELPNEAKGYVASPESKKLWVGGDTLQAAIGQSVHQFTPLQLANYIATLANGGTRYEAHMLKNAASGDFGRIETVTQPFAVEQITMQEANYQAIINGMRDVAENGTASAIFKNYPIKVGGKTGSVQVPDGTANSVFVAFAPLDDPQIAVVVIVEHGGSGNGIAPVARDIFDYYFYNKMTLPAVAKEKSLLD